LTIGNFDGRLIALLGYPEIPRYSARSSPAGHVWLLGECFSSSKSILDGFIWLEFGF
jgi:hypothetical protein